MAIGKNQRVNKGGKRAGSKKKVAEPMARKEWFDVVAPANFKKRQFQKALCNKTIGTRTVVDNMKGRVYEANMADLESSKDGVSYNKAKFQVMEVQGRNLLTQFHSMSMTTDKLRSLFKKWCTMLETVVEAKTKDGYVLRLFIIAFTVKSKGQLSKNCHARGRLENWARMRITKLVQKKVERLPLTKVVTLLSQEILATKLQKRVNSILPVRDLKVFKAKVVRSPKYDAKALLDIHGVIPESFEDKSRVVEAAPVAAVAATEATA
jgi:small subunit ribosomal protein S3Ae